MPTGDHTNNWINSLLSDSDLGSDIDDQVNQLAQAVYERMLRMGAFYKLSDKAGEQGVLFTSPDAYDADQFTVYGKDASDEPDVADPRLAVTESGGTLYGTWSVETDLTVGGDTVLTEGSSQKRTVVLTAGIRDDDSNLRVGNLRFAWPSNAGAGTIQRIFAKSPETGTGLASWTWYVDTFDGDSYATTLGSLSMASGNTYANTGTSTNLPYTFTSGDGFSLKIVENNNGGRTKFLFGVIVELDW